MIDNLIHVSVGLNNIVTQDNLDIQVVNQPNLDYKVPRETHDTPINPRMTSAFSDSNFIYVFVIACHYSSNNQSLKILPWA